METNLITPVLDLAVLQQKANDAAMKGAQAALDEFYNSYNSPYKKAIEENLKSKAVDNNFDIPDIIAVINEKLSEEVDLIANMAVSKTFIPLVKKFLTRENAEIKFSEILEKFVEHSDFDEDEDDQYDYVVEQKDRYANSPTLHSTFYTYTISNSKMGYELHFYDNKGVITLTSIPSVKDENGRYWSKNINSKRTMKITLDEGATLELPFTAGVLEDEFLSFCARLVIGNNKIVFDSKEFEDYMFTKEY